MNDVSVRLLPAGIFEIKSMHEPEFSLRVTHDPDQESCPWIILRLEALGIKWSRYEAFFELDDALASAVAGIRGSSSAGEFKIDLPCGGSFRRPGRLPAEVVMASMGWTYVTDFIGYTMIETPGFEPPLDIRRKFLEYTENTTCTLGNVDLSDKVGEKHYWCADVTMPFEGFLHVDDIHTQFRFAFAFTDVDVLETFDYRTRIPVAHHTAEICDFVEYRRARFRDAA